MKEKTKISAKKILLVIFICCLPAVWALFVPGFYGASDDIHVAWLYEMQQTLSIGQVPPRYVPDLSFGFGYPLFNFVFPLPFYVAEAFHFLGFSLVGSIKLLFLLSVPASMIFMYLFLKEFLESKLLALSGAILYAYTPYRATEIYVRGAIGEVAIYIFLPLLGLALVKIVKQASAPKKLVRWVGIGAIATACIILSHNISSYMFLPFFAILSFFAFLIFRKKALLASFLLTFLLGASIAAYFWLPALRDSTLMKYDTVFNYWDHFPTVRQLITPYFGYGASVPGPYDTMSFFLGAVNIGIVVIGTLLAIFSFRKLSKLKKWLLIWALTFFSFSLFMMNHRSLPVWQAIPYLAYFQFPWRFLTATTFLAPIFLVGLDEIPHEKYTALAIAAFAVLSTFIYFRPQDFLRRKDAYYLNRYLPYPGVSQDYLMTQEEYLRLPEAADKRPDGLYPRFFSDAGSISDILIKDRLSAKATVAAIVETHVYYNKYYFPGWAARVDGRKVDIFPGKPFGQITIPVAAGEHRVEVYFRETVANLVIDVISLLALGFGLFIILRPRMFPFGGILNQRK